MEEKICQNCKYFYQHYTKDESKDRFLQAFCGHCVYPRIKTRTPVAPACAHFCAKMETP